MEEKGQNFHSASNQEGNEPVHQISKQIRMEWKDLWDQRIEDKLVAEDVARRNYELLFVERGTVIKATKDYKPPDLEEIMETNEKLLGVKLTYPDPDVGGWGKFAREVLSKEARWRKIRERRPSLPKEKPTNGPPKKGGRGWVHRH